MVKTLHLFLSSIGLIAYYTSKSQLSNVLAVTMVLITFFALFAVYKHSRQPLAEFMSSRTYDFWSISLAIVLALMTLIPIYL